MNFCVAILILKMEENMQHSWHIMLYYFKEGTNATEMQKEMFLQFMEKGPWLIECVKKWSEKFCAGDVLLDDASRSDRPVNIDSDQYETLIENNQCYTMQEIADILKLSKSIKLLVKTKNVSFIL